MGRPCLCVHHTGAQKCLLPTVDGDSGIICTLATPLYLFGIVDSKAVSVDRAGKVIKTPIERTEYTFKIALAQRRFDEVLATISGRKLVGEAVVAFLQQRGFPEVALHLVQEDRTRFELALECGNIKVAIPAAEALNDAECWRRLGASALAQGNHEVRLREISVISLIHCTYTVRVLCVGC